MNIYTDMLDAEQKKLNISYGHREVWLFFSSFFFCIFHDYFTGMISKQEYSVIRGFYFIYIGFILSSSCKCVVTYTYFFSITYFLIGYLHF